MSTPNFLPYNAGNLTEDDYTALHEQYTSLLSNYAHCNDPPAAHGIPAIDTFYRRTQALADELDREEMGELDLLVVERRRSELHAMAHFTRGLLSPFRQLPLEVVQEIILFAVVPPGEGEHLSYTVADRSNGPWLIGKICSRWRSIVNALPAVWTTVIFDTDLDVEPITDGNAVTSLLDCFRIWLERSKSLPLNIHFRASRLTRWPWGSNMFLELIVGQCTRWKEVHLTFPAVLFHILAPIKNNLGLLEHIHFGVIGPFHSTSDILDVFSVAPRLCSASFPFRPKEMSLPWPQLRRLSHQYAAGLPDLLSRAPDLEELVVTQAVGRVLSTDLTPQFNLKRLRKLSWLAGSSAPADDFTQLLLLPSLEHLTIHESHIPQVLHPLKESTTALGFKNLCIHDSSFADYTFEFLKRAQNLETLSFLNADERPRHYVRLLRALTPTFTKTYGYSFLPKLKRLKLEAGNEKMLLISSCNHTFDFQLKALLDMLTSRWCMVSPKSDDGVDSTMASERQRLLSFHSKFFLRKSQIPEPKSLEALDVLRKEGMDIVVEFELFTTSCPSTNAFDLFSQALG